MWRVVKTLVEQRTVYLSRVPEFTLGILWGACSSIFCGLFCKSLFVLLFSFLVCPLTASGYLYDISKYFFLIRDKRHIDHCWTSRELFLTAYTYISCWTSRELFLTAYKYISCWTSHELFLTAYKNISCWTNRERFLTAYKYISCWTSHELFLTAYKYISCWTSREPFPTAYPLFQCITLHVRKFYYN